MSATLPFIEELVINAGQRSFGTTKKPEPNSGLLATFHTENNSKSFFDAAPQIYACQPHTV
jgi:hypothetical protein